MPVSIRFTLEMTPEMLDRIDDTRGEGTSREEFVRDAVREKLAE